LKNRQKLIFIRVISLFTLWFFISLFLIYYLLSQGYIQNIFFASFIVAVFSVMGGYAITLFALKPMFDTAETLDKLLKDTLHELNIPIATINANVSMLKSREKDQKNLKRLMRIEEASKKLFSLYEEVDYMIKKEINRSYEEQFDAKDVIEKEIEHFWDIKKNIKIIKDIHSCMLYADKRGFMKLFDNLISNAIKYNKENGYVKIILEDCKLTVEDSGIGMSEEEIFRIFDRYYQSNNKKEGYGIGLNIVKSYCDENFIPIYIESKKNEGTKFILQLSKIKV